VSPKKVCEETIPKADIWRLGMLRLLRKREPHDFRSRRA